MKKILVWVLLLALVLGTFAGCGCAPQQEPETSAPTEFVPDGPTANDAMDYLCAMYKDTEEPTPTPVNYDRYGIVRIAGVPFTVVWTVDVGEDLVKIIVNDDGTVTIDVNEACEVATPYTLTATITDEYGNSASHSWDMLLPAAADMVEIVEAAYALAPGESLPYQSTLRGRIISIDTVYNPEYKNITVTMVVEGAEDKPIQCYRLKGEGVENLLVGNIITVTGTLKNYNGTIEFDAGCILDYVEQGDAVEAPTDTGEILKEAYALGSGEALPYPVTLTGKVTEITSPYDANYGNITVEMVMDGYEKYPVLCYRLKGNGVDQIAVGDTITVSGIIKNYKGTVEFDSGCQLLERISGGGVAKQESFDAAQILADAKKLSSGESLDYYANLTGKVIDIDTPYDKEYGNISVIINVNGTQMLCYRLKSGAADVSKIAVGDTISVRGVIENYKGEIQFGSGSTLTNRVSGGGVAKPESSNQSQILADAKALAQGDSLDYYANLTGKVTSIDSPYDKNYKNISVYIDVNGTSMLCYRLKSGAYDCSKIAVGDTITVRGVIENYKGDIQFGSGSTLENRISGGGVAKPESSNQSQILADAAKLTQGQSLSYYANLTGKVIEIDTPYDKNYKNISVIIDVDGTQMLCYRLKSGAYDCSKIAVGDTITVRGVIENYKGEIQFGAGSTLEKRVSGGGVAKPESTDEAAILADAKALASGEKLDYYATLTGKVTEIKYAYDASYGNITLYMNVNGTKIQCYRLKSGAYDCSKIAVGDTITVRGVLENYNGTLEFLAGCTLENRVSGGGVAPDVGGDSDIPEGGTTISFADKANRVTLTNDQQVWQQNGITVTNDKAASTSNIADYAKPARFYKGSSITIEYPAMTRIVFNVAYSDRVVPLTDSLSSISGIVVTVDNLLVTVDLYEAVDSFVIPQLANQTRISDITVYTGTTPPEGGSTGGGSTTTGNYGTYVTAPQVGVAYKLGLDQTAKGATYYFTGAMSTYYGATEADYAQGVDVFLENATGGYYLYFMEGSSKQYVYIVANGTHMNFTYSTSNKSVFVFDEELDSLYTTVSGSVYYMGTYDNYVTVGTTAQSKVSSSYVTHLYTSATGGSGSTGGSTGGSTTTGNYGTYTTAPEVGVAYKLGLDQTNKGATYYFTGAMSTYYGATEADYAQGVDMFLENASGGYYLYFMEGSTKQYIYIVANGTHMNFTYSASNKSLFVFDEELDSLYATVSGSVYYMGTYDNYVTVGTTAQSKVSTSYVTHLYTSATGGNGGSTGGSTGGDSGNTGGGATTSTLDMVTAPVAGTAYKLYSEQANVSKTLCFAGTTANTEYYLTTTEDLAAATDVYLEETTGGYYLYFMDGSTKTYIDLYLSSTGYQNIRLVTTPGVVYTYNTTYNTLVAPVEGTDCYIGTYKTYETLSCSKLSYASTSFPCHLGVVGEGSGSTGGNEGGESGGSTTPDTTGTQVKYTMKDYRDTSVTAAGNYTHALGSDVTLDITAGWLHDQLRIYNNDANKTEAIVKSASDVKALILNVATNNASNTGLLNVYGSNDDGATWTLIDTITVSGNTYKDVTVADGNTYAWIKFTATPSSAATTQIRINAMTLVLPEEN